MFRVLGAVGMAAVLLVGCSSGGSGGGDKDGGGEVNTAPVITLNGDSTASVVVGGDYSDQGVTATDVQDGDLTDFVVYDDSALNVYIEGSYTVSYSVEDSGGLTASASREVIVVPAESNPDIPLTIPKAGFTTVIPSSDSQIIYVSSSEGDDANTGLSKLDPVQSLEQGKSLLRDGFPDWLVLKSGDVWEGRFDWDLSGRSVQEPIVLTSYGFGERPLIKSGANSGIAMRGGGGRPLNVDYFVLSGLHFLAHTRDPDSPEFVSYSGGSGMSFLRGSEYMLVEDNKFQFYETNIVMQGASDGSYVPKNIRLRKNLFLDSYSTVSHSQGIFTHLTEDLLVEGNIFDVCGYHSDIPEAEQTIFNHCAYLQRSTERSVFKDNIVMNASSHGVQQRSGHIMEGNFFYKTALAVFMGDGDHDEDGLEDFAGAYTDYRSVKDNMILKSRDINVDGWRGVGLDVNDELSPNGEITDNIVAHNISQSYRDDRAIRSNGVFPLSGNVVYDWGPESQDGSMYVDPERTIEEFDALYGGDGTEESFINTLRSQSRVSWNEDYDISNILQFFRDGFQRVEN